MGQWGNVSLSNLYVLNAILYVAEHGCKWRGLPQRFGNWHTIFTWMNRWSKFGVIERMFEKARPSCWNAKPGNPKQLGVTCLSQVHDVLLRPAFQFRTITYRGKRASWLRKNHRHCRRTNRQRQALGELTGFPAKVDRV